MDTIELLTPGLAKRYYDHRRIIVYSLTDSTPRHLDLLFDDLHSTGDTCPDNGYLLAAFDFSRNDTIQMNLHFRIRSEQLAREHADLRGRCACLLPMVIYSIRRPIWFFIKSDLARLMPHVEFEFFSDPHEALLWLRQGDLANVG